MTNGAQNAITENRMASATSTTTSLDGNQEDIGAVNERKDMKERKDMEIKHI